MTPPRTRLIDVRGDVPGAVWPPLFSTRSASLAALAQWLERSQWLPGADIVAGQHRQLAALADHFARHSAPFRDRLAAAGLDAAALGDPAGLARLPPLGRRDLQSQPLHVEALPAGHGPPRIFTTSGSTGEPVVVHRTAANQLHWLAMTLRYHLWAEPDFTGRIAAVRANMPHYGEAADWGAPVSTFFASGASLKIDIVEDIDRQLDRLAAFRPTSLMIYPSNLAALIDVMDARGIGLPSLERVRTIGETLADSLAELVAERFGAPPFDCYSSEEIGYLALSCPDGGHYHVMAETVIVEVVSDDGRPCAPGEIGRLLVTDLHNHATPMIRYAIGDHAEAGPPCPCGRGLPTLARILGRERNLIHLPDGRRHWPLTGFKRLRAIAPIRQYQYVQHSLEEVEVRLVVERPLSDAEEAALTTHIQGFLGYPFAIRFRYYESRIPPGPRGKFEEFVRAF